MALTTYEDEAVPNGNWTLTSDVLIKGTCTHDNPNGGFILTGGTTDTAYYLRLDEDATLHQEDGSVRAENGGLIVMEAGSTLTFDGSDTLYGVDINYYGGIITRGTSGNRCLIEGTDISNRMVYMDLSYAATVKMKYCDFHFCGSSYVEYMNAISCPSPYFDNCRFEAGTQYICRNIYGVLYFKECTLGDASCSYVVYQSRRTHYVFQDCIVNQASAVQFSDDSYTNVVIYNKFVFTNVTPASITDATPLHNGIKEIECWNLSVDEQNNLEGCEFSVYHENFEDFLDTNTVIDNLLFNWDTFAAITRQLCNQMRLTDASGQSTMMVPARIKYWSQVTDTFTWYDLSKSAGGYEHNGQYTLSLVKEGYRYQSLTLYGSSDQTWSPILIEESMFGDIIVDLDDIKGTGFVKDTDSLVNLAHAEGSKGTDSLYEDTVGKNGSMSGDYKKHHCEMHATLKDLQKDITNLKQELKSFKKKTNGK